MDERERYALTNEVTQKQCLQFSDQWEIIIHMKIGGYLKPLLYHEIVSLL